MKKSSYYNSADRPLGKVLKAKIKERKFANSSNKRNLGQFFEKRNMSNQNRDLFSRKSKRINKDLIHKRNKNNTKDLDSRYNVTIDQDNDILSVDQRSKSLKRGFKLNRLTNPSSRLKKDINRQRSNELNSKRFQKSHSKSAIEDKKKVKGNTNFTFRNKTGYKSNRK